MNLFQKVLSGIPFVIRNQYGAVFMMAACNPYDKKWKNEKGIVFHLPYWTENSYSKAVFFVPGDLVEVGADQYEVIQKDAEGGIVSISKIDRIFPKDSELWADWVSYLNYKKLTPDENNETALSNIAYRLESDEAFDKSVAQRRG